MRAKPPAPRKPQENINSWNSTENNRPYLPLTRFSEKTEKAGMKETGAPESGKKERLYREIISKGLERMLEKVSRKA